MAKKARRKAEEEEANEFTFPEFDERGFLRHEYEQTFAMGLALVIAISLGVISWAIDSSGLPVVIPVIVAIAAIVFSPFLFLRVRESAGDYTKGDWAGLILMEAFGWLGIWFLLLDLVRI
ncbi:MAG TPA: hypothetical protein VGP88_01640 [Thermoplasmata archaeon]|jgi:hypothetical protein|nr:hypothetical protein [Thermoplasmata archaeon]